MDEKSVTETAADVAKVAVGIAAMAVDALMGADRPDEGNPKNNSDAQEEQSRPENSSDPININKAKFAELVSLKHIGRGRAKRIMASRPFRSVEDLASRGIVPDDVLAAVRSRLAV